MKRSLDNLDQLCNYASHRAASGLPVMFSSPDPFLQWVVELGAREGEWIRHGGRG